jgi:hypothetical protein
LLSLAKTYKRWPTPVFMRKVVASNEAVGQSSPPILHIQLFRACALAKTALTIFLRSGSRRAKSLPSRRFALLASEVGALDVVRTGTPQIGRDADYRGWGPL